MPPPPPSPLGFRDMGPVLASGLWPEGAGITSGDMCVCCFPLLAHTVPHIPEGADTSIRETPSSWALSDLDQSLPSTLTGQVHVTEK